MIDPALTPERLAAIKAGRDPNERIIQEASRLVAPGQHGARPYQPRALHAPTHFVSARWPYAVARIHRILQGAQRSGNFERAVNGAEYPQLAKQYAETWIYYMTRTKPAPLVGVDHNPFRGMSDTDAMHKFVRFVEDICDRSTGKLGGWYVK